MFYIFPDPKNLKSVEKNFISKYGPKKKFSENFNQISQKCIKKQGFTQFPKNPDQIFCSAPSLDQDGANYYTNGFATTLVAVPGHCHEKFCFENILHF